MLIELPPESTYVTGAGVVVTRRIVYPSREILIEAIRPGPTDTQPH